MERQWKIKERRWKGSVEPRVVAQATPVPARIFGTSFMISRTRGALRPHRNSTHPGVLIPGDETRRDERGLERGEREERREEII